MKPSLDSVRAKLSRAEVHLYSLNRFAQRFVNSKPYSLGTDFQPYSEYNCVVVVRELKPIPPLLAAMMGDVLYNLRSALDHLAWQLVILNKRVPVAGPGGTQFPILEVPRTDGQGRPILPYIVGGVSTRARALLDAAQPYQRPHGVFDSDPLWILNELGNIDKHRTPLLTLLARSATTRTVGESRWTIGVVEVGGVPSLDPLEEHTTLALIKRNPPEEVHMDFELATFIALDESQPGGGEAVSKILQTLLEAVRDRVVRSFEPLF